MKFTSFLRQKLIALLGDRRIVVWYDAEGDFKSFAAEFSAPNCEVLSAEASVLKTRRRADEIYRLMNESENPAERDRCLLIYVPLRRGVTEEEKMKDPFELYAMAGAPFGDTEDQKIESLARQAMPGKADEITRLFREGKPDIALLDGLEKTQRWPLLNDVFRTETPAEIIAAALCNTAKATEAAAKPGCVDELLRLLDAAVGFKPTGGGRDWNILRPKAAEYIFFSEFVFDLPESVPDALSAVPRAGREGIKSIRQPRYEGGGCGSSQGTCEKPGARAGGHPQEGYDDSNGAHLRQGPTSAQGVRKCNVMEAALKNENTETLST